MIYKIGSALYHIWYYVVVLVSIIIILPFIVITSHTEKTYTNFFWWSRFWAKIVLVCMGYWWTVKRIGQVDPNKTYIVIGNHASEIDIMLTLAIVKNPFVFIGKKELAKVPLFGYFYRRTNILVDRASLASKRAVLKEAAKRLENGTGICIFPEGGIPDPEYLLGPFKAGAFKLAIENNIPILPLTYPDNKKRFAEFFDGGMPGRLRATLHGPIETAHLGEEDISPLMDSCYQLIHDELKSFGWTGKTIYTEEKTSFAT